TNTGITAASTAVAGTAPADAASAGDAANGRATPAPATIIPSARRQAVVATASADGRWFASTGESPAVLIWRADANATPDAAPARAIDEPGRATAATFSADARWLAVGFLDGRVLLWDMQAARVVWRGRSQGDEVLDLAFDASSSRLVSAHRHWLVEDW